MNKFYKLLFKIFEYFILLVQLIRSKNNLSCFHHKTLEELSARQRISQKNSLEKKTQVFVVIPMKDHYQMTRKVVEQLLAIESLTIFFKIMIVDNQTSQAESIHWLRVIERETRVEILRANYSFNFSKMMNGAVDKMRASMQPDDLIFILNNDIEFLDAKHSLPSFIDDYYKYEVDIMGCSLFYPDMSIQHLYAQPGVKIVAAHPFKKARIPDKHDWWQHIHQVPAVTGAAMLCRLEVFDELGGFDENLAAVGQDIDFCLKALKRNKLIAVDSKIKAIHHESKTRSKQINFSEVEYIYKKWSRELAYFPLLIEQQSRWSEPVYKSLGEGAYPWKLLAP